MLWLNLTTLWAWDNPQTKWYFYLPQLDAKGGTVLIVYYWQELSGLYGDQ